MLPLALLRTLRPHQWVKNLFVLAPLVFSKNLLSPPHVVLALTALGLFCLASGEVYLINDLVDLERDRAHPLKRRRPIASGALPTSLARLVAAALGPAVLLAAFMLAPALGAVLAGYLGLNLLYSVWLKHLPWVDVLCIATGFLLRVLGGALALDVPASTWLLVCTALLASYLALGKRAHELITLGEDASTARTVLGRYRLSQLRAVMALVAVATAAAYGLYTVMASTRELFGTAYLVATTPFALYGLFRYHRLVFDPQRERSPTEEILRDAPFLANLLLWAAAVVVVLYGLPG